MSFKTLSGICLTYVIVLLPALADPGVPADYWIGVDLNQNSCIFNGEKRFHFGPFDYTKRENLKKELYLVEAGHFPSYVENLVSGRTSDEVLGDLIYTLRAFPNHHKALVTLIRYQINQNKKIATKNTSKPLETPVECFFQRAINFSPNDAVTMSLYGYYLKEIGRLEKADDLFEKALSINPDNAKIQYSYSLLLMEMKDYDKAAIHAKKAYEIGHPPESLKKKLQGLGKW